MDTVTHTHSLQRFSWTNKAHAKSPHVMNFQFIFQCSIHPSQCSPFFLLCFLLLFFSLLKIFCCLCFYSCPSFPALPPSTQHPTPSSNPYAVVRVHRSCIWVLWLFPSSSLKQSCFLLPSNSSQFVPLLYSIPLFPKGSYSLQPACLLLP